MKKRYVIAILFIISLLPACSGKSDTTNNVDGNNDALENLTGEQFPVVNEPITVSMFSASNPNQGDWNDLLIWNDYEDKTNIKVEWEQIHDSTDEKKINLDLNRND